MAGSSMTIKDANGKEFSIDMSKIADINGDIGPDSSATLRDARKNRVNSVHEVEFVDSQGNVLDQTKLLQDASSGAMNIVALDVEMEATHSGPNHNYCIYYEDSMEKDAESFVNPFKKPLLKNHNDFDGEPLGRIKQSWFGPSALTEDRSAIHLKARVTDHDAIPKFLDGRYGTVSIGGSMGTVTCNICGKTILKDGKFKFCGHWRGETYKDQVCYWGAKDIEYHEVSTVNNPADDFAQIMKVTILTDKDDKKEGTVMNGNSNKGTEGTDSRAEDLKKSLSDIIDKILGDSTQDSNTPNVTQTQDNQLPQQETPANPETNPDNGNAKTTDAEKIQQLEKDLEDANNKNKELQTALDAANAQNKALEQELTDSKNENKGLQDMCVTLASSNKELVADSIITKEIHNGTLTEDKKENRKKELVAKSMKDLNKIMSELPTKDSQTPRTPASVSNPGIVDRSEDQGKAKDSNNGNSVDTNKNTTDNGKAKRTVDDFANDIVGKLFK